MPRTIVITRLETRARQIVAALDGHWNGDTGMCRCPAHDDRTPSLSVRLGRQAILFHCFAGCPNAAVIAALARRGIASRDLFNPDGTPGPKRPRQQGADRNALRLWLEAAALGASPAERYLRQRGLLASPADLRFHPHTPLGPRGEVRFLPAMLAAVRSDCGVIAVHRTFLDPRTGCLARFDGAKRALGALQLGAVRLAPPRDGRLGLAEGTETALAAAQMFGLPVWATLGNERFGVVAIPESVTELHLFVDHDAGGDLAERRARSAYARHGRTIVTRRPEPIGCDWNDVLIARLGLHN